jgi:hypothetical protein
MRDTTALIRKYTGTDYDPLAQANSGNKLASAIYTAVAELERIERDLATAARRLTETAEKIRQNLDAGHGDKVFSLNPLGELQNDRTDTLIALRQQQIQHLQLLVHLANQ